MEYNFKKLKVITKKKYNVDGFTSRFTIDEEGIMYVYTTDKLISKIKQKKAVEDFELLEEVLAFDEGKPCLPPVILNNEMYHYRMGNESDYILKTDMDMNEILRVELGSEYLSHLFSYDGYIYFAADKWGEDYSYLAKMDSEGNICWKYYAKEGEICNTIEVGSLSEHGGVIPLEEGRILVPIKRDYRVSGDYSIYKFQILDRDGNIYHEVKNLNMNEDRNDFIRAIRDEKGNVCIYDFFTSLMIVVDSNGKELYRKYVEIDYYNSVLFTKEVFIYCNVESGYFDIDIVKMNLMENTQKVLIKYKQFNISSIICRDEKLYICQRMEKKKTILSCFDKEDNLLWEFIIKDYVFSFEIIGDLLYYLSKDRICIYEITQEAEL